MRACYARAKHASRRRPESSRPAPNCATTGSAYRLTDEPDRAGTGHAQQRQAGRGVVLRVRQLVALPPEQIHDDGEYQKAMCERLRALPDRDHRQRSWDSNSTRTQASKRTTAMPAARGVTWRPGDVVAAGGGHAHWSCDFHPHRELPGRCMQASAQLLLTLRRPRRAGRRTAPDLSSSHNRPGLAARAASRGIVRARDPSMQAPCDEVRSRPPPLRDRSPATADSARAAAALKATTGRPIAIASSTLFWMPRATRSGCDHDARMLRGRAARQATRR